MNKTLLAVIVGGLLYIVGQYVATSPDRERQAVDAGREITVEGTATLSTTPDIATIRLGTETQPLPNAEDALSSLTKSFNQVVEVVKKTDVEEKDIRTENFYLNPQYDFSGGRQQLRGYVASQNIVVIIRDLQNIGNVISAATSAGANQIGGISFELDKDSDIAAQAEEEAIENARSKAERIAKALKANLGHVKSYSVVSGSPDRPIIYEAAKVGVGGDASSVPTVPAGETDTTIQVSVTFELR